MKKLQVSFTGVFLFFCVSVWGSEVLIASVYQYSPDGMEIRRKEITEDLYRTIRKSDERGLVELARLKSSEIPKSVLDAASVSGKAGCGYLLYGFLKISEVSLDLEIKLYDRESGKIARTFYSKTGVEDYGELVTTMSERIINYFYGVYGVERREREENTEHGVISVSSGAGYWIAAGPWADALAGIGAVYAGCTITPVRPLFTYDIYGFSLSYGMVFEYLPGMSREEYEPAFLHTVEAGFSAELEAVWYERNKVFLNVSVKTDISILVQERKYAGTNAERSVSPVVSFGAGYEYLLENSGYGIGFVLNLASVLYDPVLYRFSPSVYVRYRVR